MPSIDRTKFTTVRECLNACDDAGNKCSGAYAALFLTLFAAMALLAAVKLSPNQVQQLQAAHARTLTHVMHAELMSVYTCTCIRRLQHKHSLKDVCSVRPLLCRHHRAVYCGTR